MPGCSGSETSGKVDRAEGRAVVAVLDQLLRHLDADILLRLLRAAADVRRQQDVVHAAQRRDELVAPCSSAPSGRRRSPRRQPLRAQRLGQRVDLHHRAARRVDQSRARLHPRQLLGADHLDVAGVSGTCSVTTSVASSSASSDGIALALPSESLVSMS